MTKRYEEFISVSCTEDKRCIYELAYFIVKTSLPLVIPRNDYFVHFGEIDNNGLITQTYYDKFGEKTGTCKSSIELSVLDLSHKLEEDLLAA